MCLVHRQGMSVRHVRTPRAIPLLRSPRGGANIATSFLCEFAQAKNRSDALCGLLLGCVRSKEQLTGVRTWTPVRPVYLQVKQWWKRVTPNDFWKGWTNGFRSSSFYEKCKYIYIYINTVLFFKNSPAENIIKWGLVNFSQTYIYIYIYIYM